MSRTFAEPERFTWERARRGRPHGTTDAPGFHPCKVEHPYVRIPSTVDFPRLSDNPDNVAWFVALITNNPKRNADGWVPVPQKYLRRLHGALAASGRALKALVGAGVIERSASQRFRCTHYRLLPPHNRARRIRRDITARSVLKRMWRIQEWDRRSDYPNDVPVYPILHRWVQTITLADDAPMVGALRQIRDGHLWLRVPTGRRVYTPLCHLAAKYRRHIRLDGHDDLVMVDVSHCQPFLLIHWLRQRGCLVDDRFVDDVAACRLYDVLAQAFGCSRDVAKVRFVKMLFGYATGKYRREDAAAFRRLYPHVWTGCTEYMDGLPPVTLTAELQTMESDGMIRGAAHAFTVHCPDVPILTIHDALIVPADSADRAELLIEDVFVERYGERPTMKTKPFAE